MSQDVSAIGKPGSRGNPTFKLVRLFTTTRAGDLFEANRPLLLATLGADALPLERQVAAFDYPGALATLREMLRKAPEN